MKLISSYSLLYTVNAQNPELRDLKPLIAPWTQQRLRRVDRYIELCVAGGLNCVAGRSLRADTGVYLATRCGAVTTSARVMETIIGSRDMPKPLHFVNTLGNSACFYLTQLLHTTGNTLVISQEYLSFEAALFHAWLDLQQGRISSALVGGIDEVALPIDLHSQRLEAPTATSFTEGTHWLLLERDTTVTTATGLELQQPRYLADITELNAWLAGEADGNIKLHCAFAPTPAEARILEGYGHTHSFVPEGEPHGVFSGGALIHLSEALASSGGHGVHLARDGEGGYCVVSMVASQIK